MEHTAEFEELAGRINGMGQALLRLTAELELRKIIDGPRISAAWERAAGVYCSAQPAHQSSKKVLQHLVQLLDEARGSRQARSAQGQSRVRRPRAAPARRPGPG